MTTSIVSETETAPADKNFLPGPVLLLGAPGVGKGTQAKALMAAYGIPQISTGDILRANISNGTDLGKAAKALVDQGTLVSDDLVNQMVADRLKQPDTRRGFILDGFPRTLNQANWLDTHLAADSGDLPVVAISIVVEYEQLLHRITGRRISPAGRIYNVYSNPPAVPGICDVDGSTLVQRPDDSEAVFMERMKTFEAQTAPVIEHYRKRGRFEVVDGDRPVEEVTAGILSALKRLRKDSNQ
ncbi:adenylate kinase [Tunturiibacter gelidoferens]|uniref:Adenylate kinase n=1 Tax=Tunturiibacter lichenicola TaxID=2051959 RepID=A0A7Y9T3W6_9BACT|nr:adenylate kinase [Edaphobacter lichenicola]NYF53338.1 adenylate kinase [Edaphobacter lichenicola]